MTNGIAQVVQNLTSDHALAAKALRLPVGTVGLMAARIFSLSDLVKRWPPTTRGARSSWLPTELIDLRYRRSAGPLSG